MNTSTIINIDSIIGDLQRQIDQLKRQITTKTILPFYTDAERDALTPVEGLMIFNTTSSEVQIYESATWTTV